MATSENNLIVEAVGLSKVFADFWGRPKSKAVNGIDFEIRQGEVFGLLGPNGSGKSTTVKMLLGLLRPTSGSLKVFSRSPSDVRTKHRIGYLPEETYLYKYLTAAETLDFFGALFDMPAAERRRRIGQLLEMVGLAHSARRPVGEFSKGMARRIGLAQALINDPDLVVLDEPTSGLDPIGIREVKDLIRHLAGRGKTILLCSHLLADVEDICDRVVVMYGGRVRARGSLQELLTVSDRTRIETPRLEPEVLERVLAILNASVGEDQVALTKPSRDLEDFFMEVVRKAQAEKQQDVSGVEAGGGIADYLGRDREPDGEALLEALAQQPEEEPAPEPEPEESPDLGLLDELAAEDETSEPDEAEGAAAMTPEEKAEHNRRIRELLDR